PFSPSDEEMCFPKKRDNSSPFPPVEKLHIPPARFPSTQILKRKKPPPRELQWDQKMINAFASFALRFFVIASSVDFNFICSPFSIALSLVILHEGAVGATRKELARALGYGLSSLDISNYYAHLIDVTSDSGLLIANGAFINEKFEVGREFMESVRSSFNVIPMAIDFRDGEAAAKIVNRFISAGTKGKIGNIVHSGSFQSTDLTMANAVFFKVYFN
ncbi:hypothetical protein PMAYCL1PPCAC_11644, partial [Pristionchus mayeri]